MNISSALPGRAPRREVCSRARVRGCRHASWGGGRLAGRPHWEPRVARSTTRSLHFQTRSRGAAKSWSTTKNEHMLRRAVVVPLVAGGRPRFTRRYRSDPPIAQTIGAAVLYPFRDGQPRGRYASRPSRIRREAAPAARTARVSEFTLVAARTRLLGCGRRSRNDLERPTTTPTTTPGSSDPGADRDGTNEARSRTIRLERGSDARLVTIARCRRRPAIALPGCRTRAAGTRARTGRRRPADHSFTSREHSRLGDQRHVHGPTPSTPRERPEANWGTRARGGRYTNPTSGPCAHRHGDGYARSTANGARGGQHSRAHARDAPHLGRSAAQGRRSGTRSPTRRNPRRAPGRSRDTHFTSNAR